MKNKLNKQIIAHNFSKAASIYDMNSDVQKIAAQDLCNLAVPFIKKNHTIIDLGCGTAALSKHLHGHNVTGLDLSLSMLQQNNGPSICADMENLPIKHQAFDHIISSFAMQWLNDYSKSFSEFYSILKKDGMIMTCLPVAGSLHELKQVSTDLQCHFYFNEFPKSNQITQTLKQVGFNEVYCENKTIQIHHPNALEALKSIKNIGAKYCDKTNPINKSSFEKFKKLDDEFTVSWHVLYSLYKK